LSLIKTLMRRTGTGAVPAIFLDSQVPETVMIQSHCLEFWLYFVLPFHAFRLHTFSVSAGNWRAVLGLSLQNHR